MCFSVKANTISDISVTSILSNTNPNIFGSRGLSKVSDRAIELTLERSYDRSCNNSFRRFGWSRIVIVSHLSNRTPAVTVAVPLTKNTLWVSVEGEERTYANEICGDRHNSRKRCPAVCPACRRVREHPIEFTQERADKIESRTRIYFVRY